MPARPCRVGPKETKPSAVIAALSRHVDRYLGRHQPDPARMHVLHRILACRTAKLGTHVFVCKDCGWEAPVYNPCRDRHCPQCQGQATAEWLQGRLEQMLPSPHFQVVFTLPGELRPIAFDNQALVYALLFRTSASVLQDLAAQRLHANLGVLAVLHTWNVDLSYHPHVHCLVTAGGLHCDGDRWVETRENYLFPARIMGTMFRGRFLEGLIDAFEHGSLVLRGDPTEAAKVFRSTVRALSKRHSRWVVHVEPPRGRPVEHAVRYLARYVKRVAISDARIVEVTDANVTFNTRDDVLTLDGAEFVYRFLLHILPKEFRKVRYYGLYAPGNAKVRLDTARHLLRAKSVQADDCDSPEAAASDDADGRELSIRPWQRCPACGSTNVHWCPVPLSLTAISHLRLPFQSPPFLPDSNGCSMRVDRVKEAEGPACSLSLTRATRIPESRK
jgi:hypothetical protein